MRWASYRVEARRAYPQVVSMIQASALLHQRQRKVDGDGRLLAAADDYQLARHLLGLPMARQLGGRIPSRRRGSSSACGNGFGPEEIFTTPDAKRKESRSKSSVYGWLAELHEAGMVDKVEAQRGNRAAQWQLSSAPLTRRGGGVAPGRKRMFLIRTWKHGNKRLNANRGNGLRFHPRFWKQAGNRTQGQTVSTFPVVSRLAPGNKSLWAIRG